MLHRFPDVRRWVETDDVLQSAVIRLLRALQEVRPGSVRDFFGLAAEQMRRELLDLARRFRGPEGLAARHQSHPPGDSTAGPGLDPPDRSDDANDLERWSAFHEGVAGLAPEEREVVGLIFYQGWTQIQVAELLQVSVRTVQRRWESALRTLRAGMQKESG